MPQTGVAMSPEAPAFAEPHEAVRTRYEELEFDLSLEPAYERYRRERPVRPRRTGRDGSGESDGRVSERERLPVRRERERQPDRDRRSAGRESRAAARDRERYGLRDRSAERDRSDARGGPVSAERMAARERLALRERPAAPIAPAASERLATPDRRADIRTVDQELARLAAPDPQPGGGVPGRRTVTIRGQGAERNRLESQRRRPERRHEREGFCPDRAALWAVLLGLTLIFVAVASAHAATI